MAPPARTPVLGGFEGWIRVIGRILAFAGVQEFLANLDTLYEQADEEDGQWDAFLRAWERICGPEWLTVAQLERLQKNQELRGALPDDLTQYEALYRPPALVLLLSPSLRQSQELFRAAMTLYTGLGAPIATAQESALRLELVNQSRIIAPLGRVTRQSAATLT